MKNFFKTLFCTIAFAVLFTSCQDDTVNDIVPEALNSTSDLTRVLSAIASNDSISYTAIDSTTCFRIKLPATVVANGQQIVVADTTDYTTVDAVFTQSSEDRDSLRYVYPVTVVYPDGTEVVLTSQSQYNALLTACNTNVGTISSDCIAINYPVTVFGYNSSMQLQNTYQLNNNSQLYVLLINLGTNNYYGINYPVSLTVGGNQVITVNSNAELQQAIYAAIATCQNTTGPVTEVPTNFCISDTLRSQLVYAYSFSSATVTNDSVYDAMGTMHLRKSNVTTAADRNGNANCAIKFQGNPDSYLIGTNTAGFGSLNNMSVSLWYKAEGESNSYQLLLGRDNSRMRCPDTYGDWSILLNDGGRAVFGYNNSVWENNFTPTGTPVWKHLVVTLAKGGQQVMSIYINGQLQETKTGIADCGAAGNQLVTESGAFYIGEGFNGVIDDVAIFRSVLTAQDIMLLYQSVPCCQ